MDKATLKLQVTVEKLKGELLATQFAIRGLILSHPDRDAAFLAVSEQMEDIISTSLSRAVSDAFVDGTKRAKKRVLPPLRDLASRQ